MFVKLSNILNFSSNEEGTKVASLPETPGKNKVGPCGGHRGVPLRYL